MTAVVAIYPHPELYPPTLNAIEVLAKHFDTIQVIFNNVVLSTWDYPSNVELFPVGEYLPIRSFEQQSVFWKAKRFLHYTSVLLKHTSGASLVLTYDPIPLLSYTLALKPWSSKQALWWHHSHDVADISKLRKGSIGWFAAKMEPMAFKRLGIFSLPAEERKHHFPIDQLHGEFLFLPNYPSLRVYGKILPPVAPTKEMRLIYQGSISEGHGLEVIIPILGLNNSYSIYLTLIGPIHPVYQKKLEDCALEANTQEWLEILPPVAYKLLPGITSRHHIGLAIHEPIGEVYSTGGTASNKIYEYAACGLPVLYLNTKHYSEHLGKFCWAKAVDLNGESIINAIQAIMADYTFLSTRAKESFLSENNYESKISPIISLLL